MFWCGARACARRERCFGSGGTEPASVPEGSSLGSFARAEAGVAGACTGAGGCLRGRVFAGVGASDGASGGATNQDNKEYDIVLKTLSWVSMRHVCPNAC